MKSTNLREYRVRRTLTHLIQCGYDDKPLAVAEGLEFYKEEIKMEKELKEKLQKLLNGTGKVQYW